MLKTFTQYPVSLPEDLNLEELIIKYLPTRIKPFKLDKLKYIINLPHNIIASDQKKEFVEGWVCIHAQTLQKVVQNYKQYLDYLEFDAKVFDCIPFYTPKGKVVKEKELEGSSKHYWLKPKYQGKTKVEYLTDKVFVRALYTNYHNHKVENKKANNGRDLYPALVKPYETGLIGIDLPAAVEYLEKEYAYYMAHPEKFRIKKKKKKTTGKKDYWKSCEPKEKGQKDNNTAKDKRQLQCQSKCIAPFPYRVVFVFSCRPGCWAFAYAYCQFEERITAFFNLCR